MSDKEIIQWLLEGDVSIQYQVYRDLLDLDRKDLRKRIGAEGWGRDFLSRQKKRGIGEIDFINLSGFQAITPY